jgi:hypothetical protein
MFIHGKVYQGQAYIMFRGSWHLLASVLGQAK